MPTSTDLTLPEVSLSFFFCPLDLDHSKGGIAEAFRLLRHSSRVFSTRRDFTTVLIHTTTLPLTTYSLCLPTLRAAQPRTANPATDKISLTPALTNAVRDPAYLCWYHARRGQRLHLTVNPPTN